MSGITPGMFKVPVRWFDNSGNEQRHTAVLHAVPHVGDRIDLSALKAQVAEYSEPEAKHLECFRVLAVEHEATAFHGDDVEEPNVPSLVVLLERDPEVQHQMELEELRELADELRKHISRLVNVLNCVVEDALTKAPGSGRFALVARYDIDGPKAPTDMLAYQQESPFESSVPALALEMADVVYVQKEGAYAEPRPYICIKHRFRTYPFEVAWTGVR